MASKATIYTPLHTFYARQPFTVAYDQGRIFISDSYFTGEGVEAKLSGEANLSGDASQDGEPTERRCQADEMPSCRRCQTE